MPPHHPRWRYILPLRLRSLFARRDADRDLDDELEFHLECRIADRVARGESPDAARRDALGALQGIERCKEECRDARGVRLVENIAQDTRYAWRTLWKTPGFAMVAILTLALGIGANTAVFSVVSATLLRPLPYPRPDRLMLLYERQVANTNDNHPNVVSFANFADWQKASHSFEGMAAGRQDSFSVGSSGGVPAENISGAICSWTLFDTLGVQPLIGRAFTAHEDRPGGPPVAIISHGLWQSRFGGARDILQRRIRIEGSDRDIIGVMPPGFGYPTRASRIWLPIQQALNTDALHGRGWHQHYVVARMRDGVTSQQATAEVDAIQHRLWSENQNGVLGRGAISTPVAGLGTERQRQATLVLLASVGCLLLIACVNISNLLLARGAMRAREFAVRAALGGSRLRLIQQLLTEGALITALGAMGGLILGYGLTRVLAARAGAILEQSDIDASAPIQMDAGVLAFALLIAVAAGVAATLIPARRATARTGLARGLEEGGRSATAGRQTHRLRFSLVTAEIALSLMLLIAAGLLIRSYARLQRVQPGVRVDNVLTVGIALPDKRYAKSEQIFGFERALLGRLAESPQVRAAGLVNWLPVAGYWGDTSYQFDGHALPPGQFLFALDRAATPDYFRAAGIPLRDGRFFTDRDTRAVIVSESLARKTFPHGSAVGQQLYFGDAASPRYRVIGVVADVLIGLEDRPWPTVYQPLFEDPRHTIFAVVHTAADDPLSLAPAIRRAVAGIDPDVPVFDIRSMGEVIGESAAERRLSLVLISSFATLALLLAAIGLYGVLAYLITQRTPDIGIRMALGAGRFEVCRMVLAEGLRPAGIGSVVGLLGGFAVSRAMRSLLFATAPNDPLTFAAVPAVLAAVAVLACLVPAWRAMRVDPARTLRAE